MKKKNIKKIRSVEKDYMFINEASLIDEKVFNRLGEEDQLIKMKKLTKSEEKKIKASLAYQTFLFRLRLIILIDNLLSVFYLSGISPWEEEISEGKRLEQDINLWFYKTIFTRNIKNP